jgi:hypothetical protein
MKLIRLKQNVCEKKEKMNNNKKKLSIKTKHSWDPSPVESQSPRVEFSDNLKSHIAFANCIASPM